jgi:hypothetical protein
MAYKIISKFGKGIKASREQTKRNNNRIKSDSKYRRQEMSRATKVYHDRQKAGLDTSAQNRYIKKLQSYSSGRSSRSSDDRHFRSSVRDNEDIQEKIKELAEAKKRATIAKLDKSRSQALSTLASEEAKIQPMYYDKRNDVSTQSKINAKNFAEYYASTGQNKAGINTQAKIANQASLQRGIGDLKQAEADAFADIEKRRTNINNTYEADVASANAGYDAQLLQSAVNQMNLDRQYKLSQEKFNTNKAIQEAGLTGYYDGNQTLQSKKLNSDEDYRQKTLEMSQSQQQFSQNMATKQFEETIRQNNIKQSNWQQQFSYEQAQDKINNMYKQGQLSIQQRNVALQEAKFASDNDPNSIDNQLKQAKLESTKQDKVASNSLGSAYSAMMASADPHQWLVENGKWLTDDELKTLQKYLP